MTDRKSVAAAIREVRRGASVLSTATKYGLTRNVLRYWLQKQDAERARFRRAINEEKVHGKA